MSDYAGKAQVERYAAEKGKAVAGREQAGGKMAEPGTEADKTHSSGKLSEAGKAVWRQGVAARGSDVESESKTKTKSDK